MSLRSFTNSRAAIVMALAVSRALPNGLGHSLAAFIADRISGRKGSELIRAVRANQWVAGGEVLERNALDRAVRDTMRSVARGYFDFYHNLYRPAWLGERVSIDPALREYYEKAQRDKRATVYASPHLSNFEAAGRALAFNGLRAQLLSTPQPPGGYQWQNEMREKSGLIMTPISIESLRQATQRLQAGGNVLTGLDRPVPDIRYRLEFFGRPAPLPVIHARLAIKARCPVVVVACIMRKPGSYDVVGSQPIEMQPQADLETEVAQNAQAVLKVAEGYIRAYPRQWAMFYPVWREALEEMP